jgi:hypothetical protein
MIFSALIAAMIQGAYFRHAQESEKGIVANELLTFPSPRLPVDDALVVRQSPPGTSPTALIISAGVLRRELHGLPPKEQHVAADHTIFVLADNRFGDVGGDSHCRRGSTRIVPGARSTRGVGPRSVAMRRKPDALDRGRCSLAPAGLRTRRHSAFE